LTHENYIQTVARKIKAEVPADVIPTEDADELFLLYAALALSKGESVTRRDVHDAWSAWMTERNPRHASIKPYGELPEETKQEDEPFVVAIQRVAKRLQAKRRT
jgi:hypothetical protein